MAELLKDSVSYNQLTTVFPTPLKRYSRESVSDTAKPCLYIETTKLIAKQDYKLIIDQAIFDISAYTVKDLIHLLKKNGVNSQLIEYAFLADYPAMLLADIRSQETHTTPVFTNPLDLSRLNFLKSRTLTPLATSVKPLLCFDSNVRLPALAQNNRLYIEGDITKDTELCYTVCCEKFIWSLCDSHVTTSNPFFISKYL